MERERAQGVGLGVISPLGTSTPTPKGVTGALGTSDRGDPGIFEGTLRLRVAPGLGTRSRTPVGTRGYIQSSVV